MDRTKTRKNLSFQGEQMLSDVRASYILDEYQLKDYLIGLKCFSTFTKTIVVPYLDMIMLKSNIFPDNLDTLCVEAESLSSSVIDPALLPKNLKHFVCHTEAKIMENQFPSTLESIHLMHSTFLDAYRFLPDNVTQVSIALESDIYVPVLPRRINLLKLKAAPGSDNITIVSNIEPTVETLEIEGSNSGNPCQIHILGEWQSVKQLRLGCSAYIRSVLPSNLDFLDIHDCEYKEQINEMLDSFNRGTEINVLKVRLRGHYEHKLRLPKSRTVIFSDHYSFINCEIHSTTNCLILDYATPLNIDELVPRSISQWYAKNDHRPAPNRTSSRKQYKRSVQKFRNRKGTLSPNVDCGFAHVALM